MSDPRPSRWVVLHPPGMQAVAELMTATLPPEVIVTGYQEVASATDYTLLNTDLLEGFHLGSDGCPNC